MRYISYGLDALSPAAFAVWMRLASLSVEGIPYSDDPEVLARVCRMTPQRFAKMQAEIAAAGLDDIDPFAESFTVSESRQQNFKRNSQSGAERMRRFRSRKASQSDATVTARDEDVASHVTVCDVTQTSPVTDSDATSDDGVTQRRGSSLSLEVSPAPLPKPNPILPREVNSSASAHEGPKIKITPAMLADLPDEPTCNQSLQVAAPIPLEPDIIPPDLSDIRGAVAGMLARVVVPMSETTAELATTPPANAETTGQSAILPSAIQDSRITQPMEAEHGENPSRSATPVPPCRTDASPAQSYPHRDGLEIPPADDPKRGNHPLSGSTGRHDALTADFEAWWKQTPRKVGKGAARKAYAAARKKTDAATLTAGIMRYAQACEAKGTEPQFICHPASWLNGERWSDDEPPVPVGSDPRHSVMRPGKRASSDPVEDAYQAEMAEIAERERRERHVH